MKNRWLISCEHGGNNIPAAYKACFKEADKVLESHRGYDPGALLLHQLLSSQLADASFYSTTSRLLVELNRSLHHKNLFSAYTKELAPSEKQEIIAAYYLPYRKQVEQQIYEYLAAGEDVRHLSIHSFTPVLNEEVRNADIGLLYDPGNKAEKTFCLAWKQQLQKQWPEARIRMNYPYKGIADGFTTYLRKQFPVQYAGIEFELNQKFAGQEPIYHKILRSLQNLKR